MDSIAGEIEGPWQQEYVAAAEAEEAEYRANEEVAEEANAEAGEREAVARCIERGEAKEAEELTAIKAKTRQRVKATAGEEAKYEVEEEGYEREEEAYERDFKAQEACENGEREEEPLRYE